MGGYEYNSPPVTSSAGLTYDSPHTSQHSEFVPFLFFYFLLKSRNSEVRDMSRTNYHVHKPCNVEMTGDGQVSGDPSRDEDDFEKQMSLVNESDKTTVRVSPSQAQVDQLEG